MDHLNSDLLRTFLAVADAGSVTDGAARIFRSQSAASLQIAKLESTLGQAVFSRHGRGVELTETGVRLLPAARDIIRKLDATLRDLTADDLNGKVHLGIPDDQQNDILARIVGEFAQSHPLVALDVTCAASAGFPEALASGRLDLAVYETAHPLPTQEILRQERTCWMVARHHDLLSRDPLPVALFDQDCWWRDVALDTLEKMGRPYRIVFSSQSVAGVAAALEAGIAIGLLGETSLTDALRRLGPVDGFADMPTSSLIIDTSPRTITPPIEALRTAIRRAYG